MECLTTSLYICVYPWKLLLRAEKPCLRYCVVYRVVSTCFSWYRVMLITSYSQHIGKSKAYSKWGQVWKAFWETRKAALQNLLS